MKTFLAVLCALFAWNYPEAATGIVAVAVVIWVALCIIGKFLEGTTASESEYREIMDKLSTARHDDWGEL